MSTYSDAVAYERACEELHKAREAAKVAHPDGYTRTPEGLDKAHAAQAKYEAAYAAWKALLDERYV